MTDVYATWPSAIMIRSHFTEWTIRRKSADLTAKLEEENYSDRARGEEGRPDALPWQSCSIYSHAHGGVEVALVVGLVVVRLDTGCRFCGKRKQNNCFLQIFWPVLSYFPPAGFF